MEDKKKFKDETAALSSIANSLDLMLEYLHEDRERKAAAHDSPYYTAAEAADRRKVCIKTIMRQEAKGFFTRVFKKGKIVFFKTDIIKPPAI